jgi:hydrogenase maturation protease
MTQPHHRTLIWGIGCTLFGDQGFGIHIIHALDDLYDFGEDVELVDGGVVGVGWVGLIAGADDLIVIDAVHNNGRPGDFYRWEGEEIFQRFYGRNHVQQVEFLEALAHCQALDNPPRVVMLGIEPDDTRRLSCELTLCLEAGKQQMIRQVLAELDQLGITYRKKDDLVSCA